MGGDLYSDIQSDTAPCLLEHFPVTADDSFSFTIVSEKAMCVDDNGIDRSYGECWTKKNDLCQVCTCYDVQDVQCKARHCEPEPICNEGDRKELQTDDGCCKSFRCVKRKFFTFILPHTTSYIYTRSHQLMLFLNQRT